MTPVFDAVFTGTPGNDTYLGTESTDTIDGLGGHDSLNGGDGDDLMIGGAGNDTLVGGSGLDTVSFATSTSYVWVRLAEGTATSPTGTDTLSQIENIIGSRFSDDLWGDANANRIEGGDGEDVLDGRLGADTLVGGNGHDYYVVHDSRTVIVEEDNGGFDDVSTYVSFDISGTAVENVGVVDPNLGNITIRGNGLNNTLRGSLGNETLIGEGGDDLLRSSGGGYDRMEGGLGNDALDGRGQAGDATLIGGVDNDTYYIDGADLVEEADLEGTDWVYAVMDYTLGSALENLVLEGTANLAGTGNSLDNAITGTTGNNALTGQAGNDVLDGAAGQDTMTGGVGDDTYYVDNLNDKVKELHLEGTDTVFTSVSYSLFGRAVEVLIMTGTGGLTATGNSLNNVMTGNAGKNTLNGETGNDILDGAGGLDTLYGAMGDDTYYVNASDDQVVELNGEGRDTVIATASFSLQGTAVENLIMTGAAGITGWGNALDNVMTGNASKNTLYGDDGNDSLDGAGGIDTMYGGMGDDTYYVNFGGDKVVELAGQGRDTVIASGSYSLQGTVVEDLTVTGDQNFALFGNSLGNTLIGNSANNMLVGLGARDVLTGGLGADTFLFSPGSGRDRITDFNATDNDSIRISDYTGGVATAGIVTQSGTSVLITLTADDVVTVLNAARADVLAHIIW
ncbi:hypothetical protein ABAC460_23720 [Asticcacaulis sp. AC460]|uniref:calcium-binding protein n=1 Tax=Asticcacaulis sp. AC460 TaxID=1282360 RepID=UPI0003C40366|nr:calcium-binding protein [Asticcacaulis sp. AC460]ESQ85368.1 hypothetical protein ABAC460_23720 [Asticcacaulis sp. AC460]